MPTPVVPPAAAIMLASCRSRSTRPLDISYTAQGRSSEPVNRTGVWRSTVLGAVDTTAALSDHQPLQAQLEQPRPHPR